jgi:hypothetical protein
MSCTLPSLYEPRRPRRALPLGTVVIRRGGPKGSHGLIRYVKVKMKGGPQNRWMVYARHWWITNMGPVPDGKRVAHLDGDSMNDNPANFGLLSAADVVFLCHDRDPKMSEKNYRKLRAATSRFNRMMGEVRRWREWLPTRWYAVDHARRIIYVDHRRQRWQIFRDFGACSDRSSWRTIHRVADCGITAMRGRQIAADPNFSAFKRAMTYLAHQGCENGTIA